MAPTFAVAFLLAASWRIPIAEYRDKVYASWLGQCVGNIYGLAHEQKYYREPGPDRFPLGYSGWGAARLRQLNGAFSDDDTDVEYMYLLAMERHGIEPKYSELAAFWKRSVHHDVWLANRAAVAAMRYGLEPPWTGRKEFNPHWFQIDPQLVNEIWAVTAPGMVRYAVAKSDWAARIMADDWGVEPTLFYAAMYSAGFFESDIPKLIAIGRAALPADARFVKMIDAMLALHARYPEDWKAARREVLRLGYLEEPASTRTGTNAHINAAFAILALLYGGGDFQKTLDLACALGFDADNQAATACGLLGVIHGTKGIPRGLLFPYPELGWTEPLNDRYTVVTREELPNAGLREMAARMAAQGERVLLAQGGRKTGDVYEINAGAVFTAPVEFPAPPAPVVARGRVVDAPLVASGFVSAKGLPKGLRVEGGRLVGVTSVAAGVYPVTLEYRGLRRELALWVRAENLARMAARVVTPVSKPDLDLFRRTFLDTPPVWVATSAECLRDGVRTGPSFLGVGAGEAPRTDWYGYEWTEPRTVSAVALTTGFQEETTGWFESLTVEYRDEAGGWVTAGHSPSGQAHFAEYVIRFPAVKTRAIRVGGPVGMVPKTKPTRFSSVVEISVY